MENLLEKQMENAMETGIKLEIIGTMESRKLHDCQGSEVEGLGCFSPMDPVVTAPRAWDISHGEILPFHSVGLRFWGLGFAV